MKWSFAGRRDTPVADSCSPADKRCGSTRIRLCSPQHIQANAKSIKQLLHEANPRIREDLMFVYEGFQYDPGSLPMVNADGGWGWNGSWRQYLVEEQQDRRHGDDGTMHIGFQKLHVPWPIRGGRAGMLELESGNRTFVRPLAKPISLARDAVYYLSMMMRAQGAQGDEGANPRREVATLTLRGSGRLLERSCRIRIDGPAHAAYRDHRLQPLCRPEDIESRRA